MGNLEEGSSTGDFESWMKGPWEWGIALSRGSEEGASGRAPLRGNPKDEWRAPEREHLSFCELCLGASFWGSRRIWEEGSEDGYVLSPGTVRDS